MSKGNTHNVISGERLSAVGTSSQPETAPTRVTLHTIPLGTTIINDYLDGEYHPEDVFNVAGKMAQLFREGEILSIFLAGQIGLYSNPYTQKPTELNAKKGRPLDQSLGAICELSTIAHVIDFDYIRQSNEFLTNCSDEAILGALKAIQGFCFINVPLKDDVLDWLNSTPVDQSIDTEQKLQTEHDLWLNLRDKECKTGAPATPHPHLLGRNVDGKITTQILYFRGEPGSFLANVMDIAGTDVLAVTSANHTKSPPAPVTDENMLLHEAQSLGVEHLFVNPNAAFHSLKAGSFSVISFAGSKGVQILRHGNVHYRMILNIFMAALNHPSIPAGLTFNLEDQRIDAIEVILNEFIYRVSANRSMFNGDPQVLALEYVERGVLKLVRIVEFICLNIPNVANKLADALATILSVGDVQAILSIDEEIFKNRILAELSKLEPISSTNPNDASDPAKTELENTNGQSNVRSTIHSTAAIKRAVKPFGLPWYAHEPLMLAKES